MRVARGRPPTPSPPSHPHFTHPPPPHTLLHPAPPSQEVASNHGVSLWGRTEFGFATDPIMAERNLIFAMTRLQIQMDRYPKW